MDHILARLLYVSSYALVASLLHHVSLLVGCVCVSHVLHNCLNSLAAHLHVCPEEAGSLTFPERWAFYCPVSTLYDRVCAKLGRGRRSGRRRG